MKYLSNADRKSYTALTAWEPRTLNKSEKIVALVCQLHTADPVAEASPTFVDEIHAQFGHMYERRMLVLAALKDKAKLDELLALYPNVGAFIQQSNRPTKGLLGAALEKVTAHQVLAAHDWFAQMVSALSRIPKLNDFFLVYSGVGPNKALIHRSAIETKNPLLYGVAVPAAAQKTFIDLFDVKNHTNLRLILNYELHLDNDFTGGEELEINERVLEGFLCRHTLLDFNYRGHKATFFTKL